MRVTLYCKHGRLGWGRCWGSDHISHCGGQEHSQEKAVLRLLLKRGMHVWTAKATLCPQQNTQPLGFLFKALYGLCPKMLRAAGRSGAGSPAPGRASLPLSAWEASTGLVGLGQGLWVMLGGHEPHSAERALTLPVLPLCVKCPQIL